MGSSLGIAREFYPLRLFFGTGRADKELVMMTMRERIYKVAALLLVSSSAGAATKAASTVTLAVKTPSALIYGQEIDGVAQVTAGDGAQVSGTVTFYDGGASFCVLTLANGSSCPEGTVFSAGTHAFAAVYSGDGTHARATSNEVTVAVAKDTTTAAVASSANPMAVGGGVVYTAQVAGAHGRPTGMVRFLDGAETGRAREMGEAPLDANGQAALAAVMLTAGDHAITAVYAGDGNSEGSSSTVLHETVTGLLAATTTVLGVNAGAVSAGQSVVLTAKVEMAANAAAGSQAIASTGPGGTVGFSDGKTVLGSVRVSDGVAAWSMSTLGVGSHSLVAAYQGDAWTAASLSAPVNVEVTQVVAPPAGPPVLTLGAGTVTVAAGDWVQMPVAVSGGSAKTVGLSCSGLPAEAACSFDAGMLKITTSAPRDCGSLVPYGDASAKGAVLLMLLFVPRRKMARLLGILCAVLAMGAMTGCGTGGCTDLGTRPGTYTVTVSGSVGGAVVSQKVKLVVTP